MHLHSASHPHNVARGDFARDYLLPHLPFRQFNRYFDALGEARSLTKALDIGQCMLSGAFDMASMVIGTALRSVRASSSKSELFNCLLENMAS